MAPVMGAGAAWPGGFVDLEYTVARRGRWMDEQSAFFN